MQTCNVSSLASSEFFHKTVPWGVRQHTVLFLRQLAIFRKFLWPAGKYRHCTGDIYIKAPDPPPSRVLLRSFELKLSFFNCKGSIKSIGRIERESFRLLAWLMDSCSSCLMHADSGCTCHWTGNISNILEYFHKNPRIVSFTPGHNFSSSDVLYEDSSVVFLL